jgi:hypothetical protein
MDSFKAPLRAIVVATLTGCASAGGYPDMARETAAREYACPLERVRVHSDVTAGLDYAYWLDVCGRLHLYAYHRPYTGPARFVDTSSSGGP